MFRTSLKTIKLRYLYENKINVTIYIKLNQEKIKNWFLKNNFSLQFFIRLLIQTDLTAIKSNVTIHIIQLKFFTKKTKKNMVFFSKL